MVSLIWETGEVETYRVVPDFCKLCQFFHNTLKFPNKLQYCEMIADFTLAAAY